MSNVAAEVPSDQFLEIATLELDCTPLSLRFIESPSALAVGGSNGKIYMHRLPDLRIESRIQAHDLGVRSITYSRQRQTLLASSYDKISLLRRSGAQWELRQTQMTESVAQVLVRPGKNFGYSLVGYGSQMHVITKNRQKRVATTNSLIRTGNYSDCGKHLCFGDRRGQILLVDAEKSEEWKRYKAFRVHTQSVRSVDSIPGSENFVSCGEDGRVALIDCEELVAETLVENLRTKLVCCTGIDSRTVAVGGTNNMIYVIDIPSRRVKQVLKYHQGTVAGLDSNRDLIASIGYDSKVILWSRQPSLGHGIRGLVQSNLHRSE